MNNPKRVKTVGQGRSRLSYWERFNRLQRTAGKVMGGLPYSKGVYRFRTFEEQNEWQMQQIMERKRRAPRRSATS